LILSFLQEVSPENTANVASNKKYSLTNFIESGSCYYVWIDVTK